MWRRVYRRSQSGGRKRPHARSAQAIFTPTRTAEPAMDTQLKPADTADLPALLRFVEAYYRFEEIPFRRDGTAQAVQPLMAEGDAGRIWMITVDGHAAGYVALCYSYSIESLGRDALIDELYVGPAYRGHGVGRRALELVVEEARRRGVKALYLEVARDNPTARRLYASVGFAARDKFFLMERPLD